MIPYWFVPYPVREFIPLLDYFIWYLQKLIICPYFVPHPVKYLILMIYSLSHYYSLVTIQVGYLYQNKPPPPILSHKYYMDDAAEPIRIFLGIQSLWLPNRLFPLSSFHIIIIIILIPLSTIFFILQNILSCHLFTDWYITIFLCNLELPPIFTITVLFQLVDVKLIFISILFL